MLRDADMNDFKIAIIPREKSKVEKRGHLEDGFHSKTLLDYAIKAYPNYAIFQQLTVFHQPEVISFFLTELENIVFLHMTHNDKNQSHSGTLFIPKDVTEEQKKVLYSFMDSIELKSLTIVFDLFLEDGLVDGKEMYSNGIFSTREVLDEYFSKERHDLEGKGPTI